MTDDIPTEPVTGVCIVADPYKCPPRYDLLYKSWDRKDDCDLWKDGLFRAKTTRYICITRSPATIDGGQATEVLTDLVIQNDKEYPPPGYQLLEKTKDTCDKATNKKQICIKMVERGLANEAISDVIILSRNKRAPSGYTMAGEINGLVICFRLLAVSHLEVQEPTLTANQSQQLNSTPQHVANGSVGGSYFENHVAAASMAATYTRQDSTGNALSGVPFQLNPRLVDSGTVSAQMGPGAGCFAFKSREDLENEFNYSFTLEKTSLLMSNPSLSNGM